MTVVEPAGDRRGPEATARDWWRQAVVYQVYLRSFSDSDGDGIGDFAGVLSRVDYLASLDVDAVWFSPFYPSALADGGYDVDDYRDVDPSLGTLDDFDAVVGALHARGIRVIVDIVPNHSSDRHVWFRQALASPAGSAARSRYLFRDGRGADGDLPPNDWRSAFGGPAWTRTAEPDGTPGQWYFHLFTPQQPDWNWDDRDVRDDFIATLRFWGDRGVDGFRVDVAAGLAKDMSEPYPDWESVRFGPISFLDTSKAKFDDGRHPLFDRDELDDIYAEWRRVFDTYDPPLFAVAEAWVLPHRQARYARKDGLGQSFNFDLLAAGWDIDDFATVIQRNLEFAEENDTTSTWVLSNHDVIRHATRYSGSSGYRPMVDRMERPDDAAAARGLDRARAATLLALALPGSAYLYQGEELGLPEVFDIPAELAQDPSAIIENGVVVGGRDGCRVPLPWTSDGDYFGFSDGAAHLPQPDRFETFSVQRETADPASTLSLYRHALHLRRRLQTSEHLEWLDLGPHLLAFTRANGWTSVTNFGSSPQRLPSGTVVARTDARPDTADLAADSTAWLVRSSGGSA